MKLNNYTIYNFFSEINGPSIAVKLANANLSASASYKRMKNLKVLNDVYKDIIETHDTLVKKHGKFDKEINNYAIDKEDIENKQKFTSDFNEVLKMEEEVNIRKFDMYELDGRLEFTSNDFAGILFMIDMPDTEDLKKEDEGVETRNKSC